MSNLTDLLDTEALFIAQGIHAFKSFEIDAGIWFPPARVNFWGLSDVGQGATSKILLDEFRRK